MRVCGCECGCVGVNVGVGMDVDANVNVNVDVYVDIVVGVGVGDDVDTGVGEGLLVLVALWTCHWKHERGVAAGGGGGVLFVLGDGGDMVGWMDVGVPRCCQLARCLVCFGFPKPSHLTSIHTLVHDGKSIQTPTPPHPHTHTPTHTIPYTITHTPTPTRTTDAIASCTQPCTSCNVRGNTNATHGGPTKGG